MQTVGSQVTAQRATEGSSENRGPQRWLGEPRTERTESTVTIDGKDVGWWEKETRRLNALLDEIEEHLRNGVPPDNILLRILSKRVKP